MQPLLEQGESGGAQHHRRHRLDGEARCTTSATSRSSTARRHCRRCFENLSPQFESAGPRPRAQVLDPVAGRDDRALGQHRGGRRRHVRQRPLRPQVQGPGDGARRDARHGSAGDGRPTASTGRGATKEDWLAAIDKVGEAVDSGQIRRVTGNEYTEDLTSGNVVASVGWSGDALPDRPRRRRVAAPRRGLHPLVRHDGDPGRRARTRAAALEFMNFVYEPEVQADIAEFINYVTPVAGVKEILEKRGPEARRRTR